VIKLIQHKICLYVSHTNFDVSCFGLNSTLFDLFGLENNKIEYLDKKNNMGRIGYLKNQMPLQVFAKLIKTKLGMNIINFYGKKESLIKKVAVCSGSGANNDYILQAHKNLCDVYLTGDIKYHAVLNSIDLNLSLIDITHWASERIFGQILSSKLNEQLFKNYNKYQIEIIVADTYNQYFNYV
jgi:dinuclear metal center YbgI/SA1388 family protein